MSVYENYLFAKIILVFVVILTILLDADAQELECGQQTKQSKAPWQVGIYDRSQESPYLIWRCGGTLISHDVILSAAHLLWDDDQNNNAVKKESIAVAVGNISRIWVDELLNNNNTQKSDVKELELAPGFRQVGSNSKPYYIEDLAVIVTTDRFIYNDFIKPVCVNFDAIFQDTLPDETKGTAASWENKASPKKFVKELYYVGSDACTADKSSNNIVSSNKPIGTGDKFCVDIKQDNSAICVGDSGIGLTFPIWDESGQIMRYYLRGVLSGPLDATKTCTIETYYAFTSLIKHESLIRQYWNDTVPEIPKQIGKCKLPPKPDHGTYTTMVEKPKVEENDNFTIVKLTVTCDPGYGVVGQDTIQCFDGYWPVPQAPSCVLTCQLKSHPSVDYRCLVSGDLTKFRNCSQQEPIATIISPKCKEPDFYATSDLTFMQCKDDGHWNYVATCKEECGRLTPDGKELVVGGVRAKKGELPWHVGIYTKTTNPFSQICGGSLITKNQVISAAHCFWTVSEKKQPASMFAVAVGKIFRPWADNMDDGQTSNVKEIHIPQRYQGVNTNFQDDIAMVVLENPFTYRPHVRPVCLNFDVGFDNLQLRTGNTGKVAGWGLTSAHDSKASLVLQVLKMPSVDVGTCLADSPKDFVQFITADKICAGVQNNSSALCKGDSGGGLAFPSDDRGVERYYLRGVVSTAPSNNDACNTETYTSFTQILKHADFIKAFLTDI